MRYGWVGHTLECDQGGETRSFHRSKLMWHIVETQTPRWDFESIASSCSDLQTECERRLGNRTLIEDQTTTV